MEGTSYNFYVSSVVLEFAEICPKIAKERNRWKINMLNKFVG
jgi:hypothetical protein